MFDEYIQNISNIDKNNNYILIDTFITFNNLSVDRYYNNLEKNDLEKIKLLSVTIRNDYFEPVTNEGVNKLLMLN